MANFNFFIVGGGGGGGRGSALARGGGGGGAGGIAEQVYYAFKTAFAVTVGNGGAGAVNTSTSGSSGGNSAIAGVATAIGGGGGGSGDGGVGQTGGCGGGAGDNNGVSLAGGVASQQYNGGANAGTGAGGGSGGGGGGALAAGANGVQISNAQTAGGLGVTRVYDGVSRTYSQGGNGGGYMTQASGAAGANYGWGGGGAGGSNASVTGGAGAQGIVLIWYVTGTIQATGGVVTTSGGITWHTFTGNGTFTVTAQSIDIILVGGGGGGGKGSAAGRGGGGGGGGQASQTSFPVTGPLSYAITIGAAGAAAANTTSSGGTGGSTIVGALTGVFGGGGGSGGDGGTPGSVNGSGGGAGDNGGLFKAGGVTGGGGGSANNGGSNSTSGGSGGSGGGGGGVLSVGSPGVLGGGIGASPGGGYSLPPDFPSWAFGGGGNGGSAYSGENGADGLTRGYGGGGGGAGGGSGTAVAGAGAPGLVVFRYPTGSLTGSLQPYGGNVTTGGGFTYHAFFASGTFVVGPLSGSSSIQTNASGNLTRGGVSLAGQSGAQFSTVIDLSPGYRPPATLLPSGYETLEDNAGASVPGGLVWSYLAGTTTPLPTYTDSTLTVVNTNPIICDGAGRWAAWVPLGTSYKLVFETPAIPPAHGSVIRTVDGLQVLSLPVWALNPYNVANYATIGGGTWTVEPGDQQAYYFMLDGKRLFVSLALAATSVAGTVQQFVVALPPGIVSAAWVQSGPTIVLDNSGTVVAPSRYFIAPNSPNIQFLLGSGGNFTASVNSTYVYFNGVVAIT